MGVRATRLTRPARLSRKRIPQRTRVSRRVSTVRSKRSTAK